MKGIFEQLDKCNLEIRKEKRRRRYQLHLYNSLYENGHIAKMGDPTLTWLILGDKCTATATLNGKELCYLVYGGQWSKKIIDELMETRGKSRKAIWRDLKRLKKVKRIDYETRAGVGTRIVVYPIAGTFERRFKVVKEIGRNDLKQGSKRPMTKVETTFDKSQNDLYQNGIGEEPTKENKQNSETGKNGSPLSKTLAKTKTTTQPNGVVVSLPKTEKTPEAMDVLNDIIISRVFKELEEKTIGIKKLKQLIQGKDPEKIFRLALYAKKHAKNNVSGYFVTLISQDADIPESESKARPKVPPPAGGYQTGKGALLDSNFYMSCIPQEAIAIAQQKFPKDVKKAVVKLLDVYHTKYDPRDYYKTEDQLTEEEKERMVEIIKKWDKIPD